MTYCADPGRCDGVMRYRRTGRSGLDLPLLSLGFWHNFGDDRSFAVQREIAVRAFDLGITHFDPANNCGPPYGSAEINAGRLLREDLAVYRDELIVSTKAGWHMWPGPYGQGGGSVRSGHPAGGDGRGAGYGGAAGEGAVGRDILLRCRQFRADGHAAA